MLRGWHLPFAECGATRVVLDLAMVLSQAPVAAFLLSVDKRFAQLLKGLSAFQETLPWVRMTREHAAFESTMWRNVSKMEVRVLTHPRMAPPLPLHCGAQCRLGRCRAAHMHKMLRFSLLRVERSRVKSGDSIG